MRMPAVGVRWHFISGSEEVLNKSTWSMEFFCIIVVHFELENDFLLASFGWSMTYQYSNLKNVKGIGLEGRK